MDAKLNACLNLNRRMPPVEVETTLDNLITLAGDDMEETLCQTIDVPLGDSTDPEASKKFITCDYNRDGDSFRSPYTNKYVPEIEDVEDLFLPSPELRKFEVKANHAFNIYRDLYFQGGISSVYCWDLEKGAFASCWACKKDVEKDAMKLHWSEIHIFEVKPSASPDNWDYKLTSTVIVHTDNVDEEGISLNVSGNRTIQKTMLNVSVSDKDIDNHHVKIMGKMAEQMSSNLLSSMAGIYYAKTNEIMSYLHQNERDQNLQNSQNLRNQMKKTLKAKNSTV